MTPSVGPKNELQLHSILILVAFLVPLLIFGVYPPPLLGSVITPTVEKWVGTIVALGAR
jgi:NADH:ubiquinone oxidoreductase subunit 4 (subunit M)